MKKRKERKGKHWEPLVYRQYSQSLPLDYYVARCSVFVSVSTDNEVNVGAVKLCVRNQSDNPHVSLQTCTRVDSNKAVITLYYIIQRALPVMSMARSLMRCPTIA